MADTAPATETTQNRPEKRSGRVLQRLLVVGLALGVAGFLGASALFVFQESQVRGMPAIPGGLAAIGELTSRTGGEGNGGFAHQNGPCASCHKSISDQARLYIAINGRDVSDSPSVQLRAGDTLELAFHFEGMLGDPAKHRGVGVEIITPASPAWTVAPGSGKAVEGWSVDGKGRSFWSPAWSQAGAGNGGKGGRWKPVSGQSGAYYLDYADSSWAVPDVSAAAADDGGPADGDGRANTMGADALIGVPLKQPPGKYEVVVGALGVDRAGMSTQATRRISVQVEPGPTRTLGTKAPSFKRLHGENVACGRCHRAGRQIPENHQGMANSSCASCHTTTISAPAPTRSPQLPHSIEGRANCLSCHNVDGLVPEPADHGGRPNTQCVLCHKPTEAGKGQTLTIPHSLEGRTDCAGCHTGGIIEPLPADHLDRPAEMCAVCHPRGDNRPTVGGKNTPHPVAGREQCLTCHSTGFLRPAPASHAGRDDATCHSCHRPTASPSVPGRSPDVPHAIAGRSDCQACHGPAGLRPVPASHAGRTSPTCTGCHRTNVDKARTALGIPHEMAGREACLTCHGSYLVPVVPANHKGRTNDLCVSCHQPPGSMSS